MQRIGILTCLYTGNTCVRGGCLDAFFKREAFFKDYPQDTVLASVTSCNGCKSMHESDPVDDPDMAKKIQNLCDLEIDTVHLGACRICCGKECRRMTQIAGMLEDGGFKVVRGTHAEH